MTFIMLNRKVCLYSLTFSYKWKLSSVGSPYNLKGTVFTYGRGIPRRVVTQPKMQKILRYGYQAFRISGEYSQGPNKRGVLINKGVGENSEI